MSHSPLSYAFPVDPATGFHENAPRAMGPEDNMHEFVKRLGIEGTLPGAAAGEDVETSGQLLESVSPADGSVIATVRQATRKEYEALMERSLLAFERWRRVPAPARGEVVRQIGNALRDAKADLGALVSLEMGKIRAEGEGEVQE
ncbi:MAG: aldehyde dehydrogenase family protein, partial [Myxococcota bacterium]